MNWIGALSIKDRWADRSKAVDFSSNPHSTREPPSAFFPPIVFGTKTSLHGVPTTHSEGKPWTPNIWGKNNWQPVGMRFRHQLRNGAGGSELAGETHNQIEAPTVDRREDPPTTNKGRPRLFSIPAIDLTQKSEAVVQRQGNHSVKMCLSAGVASD